MIQKIKKILLRSKISSFVIIVLIIGTVYSGVKYFSSNNDNQQDEKVVINKDVEILKTDRSSQNSNIIETVGTVKAEAKIDVVAIVGGTVSSDFFEIGDDVFVNQVLSDLFSNTLLTNYTNAQTNYSNAVNSLDSTKRLTDESIRQAGIGVLNAEEAIKSAEISLENAKDNLNNSIALQEKSVFDTQDAAISSFYSYLNTINTTLDQVNYIIQAEDGIQLANIDRVLAKKNIQSLYDAKGKYVETKNSFNNISKYSPNRSNIKINTEEAVEALKLTKEIVDDTIVVLNNTITDNNFTSVQLSAQLTSFSTLRNTVVTALLSAQSTLQGLENSSLQNKQSLDVLENAVASAENQLRIAKLGYDNAIISLSNSEQAQDQQLIGAQTSLDSIEGQLNLTGNQVVDMTVRAPISGKVTGKFVELGAEINPGQKIAEISQAKNVKIEINLSSDDIYRIELGQKVLINDDLEATILTINPSADLITKKVMVEIFFDNSDEVLIPGTFVSVNIPVEKITKTNKNSVFVPLKSVIITQNENFLFVNNNGIAEKFLVELGRTEGALVEVLNGLEDGVEIVVEGAKSLKEGDAIRVK